MSRNPTSPLAVLLYYKYVDLGEAGREACKAWYTRVCDDAGLRGRVRVALDGVNCTLGGDEATLLQHIDKVKAHAVLRGSDIDFKLSPSTGALNAAARRESGFDRLSVNAVKEVVSLGAPAPAELSARHVSPQEFHELIAAAAAGATAATSTGTTTNSSVSSDTPAADSDSVVSSVVGSGGGGGGNGVVLLDARNGYESDIGRFAAPGCVTLAPRTRQFSDLPRWIDGHLQALEGRRVLMYCTGGVRCERASAYLRAKGPAFSDVVQLSGGIERYLQAFPGGGHFEGRNFVFDERVAVAPAAAAATTTPPPPVVGRCVCCAAPWDDYGARARCGRCRVLMLLCPACAPPCAAGGATAVGNSGDAVAAVAEPLECEACAARARDKAEQRGQKQEQRRQRARQQGAAARQVRACVAAAD